MLEQCNFENPEKKPLNELIFLVKKDGVQMKVPALSEHWVKSRCYTKYLKLPFDNDKIIDSATIDEWLNEAKWFNKDLEFLLGLEHFRFWSYMVYEKQCMEIIIGFLQEAVPYYISLTSLTTNYNVIIIYTEILQNILRILCRLITNKESDLSWITKEHLKELLYTKFLISIPMIFDIIIAYGRKNYHIISKIIKTIFKIEPKYNEDLKIAIQFLQNAFNVIKRNTEGIIDEENLDGKNCSFDDLALYTLDCASTISILLEIYPEARIICNELQFEQSITKFYDNTIPLLYKNIYTINDSSKSLTYINQARLELIKAFRAVVYQHIENILKEPENSLLPAENFIAVLTECLADRTFVVDYQRYYPVENDVDILKQACKELDVFKTDFVLKAYTSEAESYLIDLVEKNGLDEREENPAVECDNEIKKKTDDIIENGIHNDVSEKFNRDIIKEVSNVLDVLPHLGDGFIRRLLSRYDNPEQAIAAYLENNLPPDLENVDQNEIYIPDDPRDKFHAQTGIERYNIFDGDEYDILTRDNPNCIIKTKKKQFPGQPKNAKQLLDDKTFVKDMKKHYQQYEMIEDDHEYEDEYDDSYDAYAESESKTAKSKIIKGVIANEINDSESDEEDDDYDDNNDGSSDNKNQLITNDGRDNTKDFCENPELIRARYEANRNAKYANHSNKSSQQKTKDVIGKSKGQGQEKDVLINRQKKEVHKSSRSNHNRKSGASWKRSRGMIPS